MERLPLASRPRHLRLDGTGGWLLVAALPWLGYVGVELAISGRLG